MSQKNIGAEAASTEKASVDYLKKFGGAITLEKAGEIFGKSNAVVAYKAAAAAGGYGDFKEEEMPNMPLALPADDTIDVRRLRDEINVALNQIK